MDEISLGDYLRILAHRKWIIIWTTIAALVLGTAVVLFTPKTYMAESTLIFPQEQQDGIASQLAQLAGIPMLGGSLSLTGQDVYVTVLRSRTISESVIKRFGLDRYDVDYEDMQERLVIRTPKEGGLILSSQVPTSWLNGKVPNDQLKERTAQLASDITNAYVTELKSYDRTNSLFMGRKNRLFIEGQLVRTKAELAKTESRLERFQQANPTLIPPDQTAVYGERIMDLATKQTEAEVALKEANSQLARARTTWGAGAPQHVSPEAIASSPAISEMRLQLAQLEVKRAALLENFTDSHPDVVGLTQEIDKTRDRMRSEVQEVINGRAGSESLAYQELLKQLVILELARDGMEARNSALTTASNNIEKRLSLLPPKEIQYARLLRDVKAGETVYTTLLSEHAKACVTEGQDKDGFIVLDEAVVPEDPAKPKVKLTLAAALMLGLMVGVLVATAQGVPPSKIAA